MVSYFHFVDTISAPSELSYGHGKCLVYPDPGSSLGSYAAEREFRRDN